MLHRRAPLSPRARVALALLVTARLALGAMRYASQPARLWNIEEAYNATVAWLITHAPMADQLLRLQYRSFCGGCTAVAALGAPAMWLSDRLWVWKALALAWTAATGLLGFFALDAWLGRAAAWAFVALFALPSVGGLDLSLMLWGNHQESGLFLMLALGLLARGRGLGLGLALGLGVWFARTSAYQVLVLAPAALWWWPAQRRRLGVGLALGLLPILLPAAAGDSGWYDFDHPLAGSWSEAMQRAGTLFDPRELALRLWYPARDMSLAGAALLGSVGLGALAALREARSRLIVALAGAYAFAYSATDFPIYLVRTQLSVNNIRYHAPWFLLLGLVLAAGIAALWGRGRRGAALGLGAVAALCQIIGLVRLDWTPDARAGALSALSLPQLVGTATVRLPLAALARDSGDPRAAAVLARMRGLKLGKGLANGELTMDEVLGQLDNPVALSGLGEALVAPCASAAEAEAWLNTVPAAARGALGRGLALTLSLCPTAGDDVQARLDALRGADCALCSAVGPVALRACGEGRSPDVQRLGACLARVTEGPDAAELLFGAGRAFADPLRRPDELDAVATALGPQAAAFLSGAADPAAGSRIPPFPRSRPAPGKRPAVPDL